MGFSSSTSQFRLFTIFELLKDLTIIKMVDSTAEKTETCLNLSCKNYHQSTKTRKNEAFIEIDLCLFKVSSLN